MKPKIWIEANLATSAEQRLRPLGETIRSKNSRDAIGARCVVLGSTLKADRAFIEKVGAELVIIARTGIGVDNVDLDAATEAGVLVVNTPDAPTESTAEHTVALLLSLAKRVVRGHASLTGSPLPREQLFGTELKKRVLGIVGYGRIGRRVAEICGGGLGMAVVAYDPFIPQSAFVPPVRRAGTLEELLRVSDVVTLHVALSEETRHAIGANELGLMRQSAYLINASRGAVVDEQALVEALERKQIAGAALDVFDVEPPADDNPLLRLENVVVTPHISSYTDGGVEAMGSGVCEQVEAVFRGDRPRYLVNPDVWPGRLAGSTGKANE